jgi:hypothetical protein
MDEEKKEEQPQTSKITSVRSRMRRNSCMLLQPVPNSNQILQQPQIKNTETEIEYKKRYSYDYTDKKVILIDINFK